jgi:hypothetical protein
MVKKNERRSTFNVQVVFKLPSGRVETKDDCRCGKKPDRVDTVGPGQASHFAGVCLLGGLWQCCSKWLCCSKWQCRSKWLWSLHQEEYSHACAFWCSSYPYRLSLHILALSTAQIETWNYGQKYGFWQIWVGEKSQVFFHLLQVFLIYCCCK